MTESTTQNEDAEIAARVTKLVEALAQAVEGSRLPDAYAALTYCLGRCISASHAPADLLCQTIPRLAEVAQVGCRQVSSLDDLEEELSDGDSQPTHRSH